MDRLDAAGVHEPAAGPLEALVDLRTRELSDAREAAEAAAESRSRFVAHVSHEVRTPLNAIPGYPEMLGEELSERGADDLLPDLEKIRRAAVHRLALVNEVLDLGKIEAGRAELHLTEVDAGRLVEEAIDLVAPLLKSGQNRLETSGLEGLGTVFSDEGKLRQVLLNLLSNAARLTERGTIRVAASVAAGTLEIRVSDTGAGMSPEQLERVFTPCAQAEPGTAARCGGTGLGLVISRGCCGPMRDTLAVEGAPGEGSVFTVRVPARPERRAGGRGAPAALPLRAPSAPGRGSRRRCRVAAGISCGGLPPPRERRGRGLRRSRPACRPPRRLRRGGPEGAAPGGALTAARYGPTGGRAPGSRGGGSGSACSSRGTASAPAAPAPRRRG